MEKPEPKPAWENPINITNPREEKMRIHVLTALLLGLTLMLRPVYAEINVSVGEISITPFSVKGLTISKTYKIDADFGKKHGRDVPAPYRFDVPVSDSFTPWFNTPQKGDSTQLKISFATKEKQLIENIRFIPFTVDLKEKNERVKATANLLANEGFQMATKGFSDVKRLGVVQADIAGYDAVVVVGQYTDPSLGPMFVRLVGILNPDAEDCVMMVANFNPKLSAANAPDKLHLDGITYKVIESFRYLDKTAD